MRRNAAGLHRRTGSEREQRPVVDGDWGGCCRAVARSALERFSPLPTPLMAETNDAQCCHCCLSLLVWVPQSSLLSVAELAALASSFSVSCAVRQPSTALRGSNCPNPNTCQSKSTTPLSAAVYVTSHFPLVQSLARHPSHHNQQRQLVSTRLTAHNRRHSMLMTSRAHKTILCPLLLPCPLFLLSPTLMRRSTPPYWISCM